jgi:hypothetical protein
LVYLCPTIHHNNLLCSVFGSISHDLLCRHLRDQVALSNIDERQVILVLSQHDFACERTLLANDLDEGTRVNVVDCGDVVVLQPLADCPVGIPVTWRFAILGYNDAYRKLALFFVCEFVFIRYFICFAHFPYIPAR